MKKMMEGKGVSMNIPEEFKDAFTAIVELTDAFCETHLNEDYRQLCREMTTILCQAGSPINRGRPASWASGIVHALGWVNFLQDPTLLPYMTSAQVAEGFGVSQGTMMAKSRVIRDELDLIQLDPDWCTPAMLKDNPLVWMLEVNGFVTDIRTAPRLVQDEAYRMGLIPFIPAHEQKPERESGTGTKIIKFPSGQNETSRPKSPHKPKDDVAGLFEESEE
jgi:hypothetical protein